MPRVVLSPDGEDMADKRNPRRAALIVWTTGAAVDSESRPIVGVSWYVLLTHASGPDTFVVSLTEAAISRPRMIR